MSLVKKHLRPTNKDTVHNKLSPSESESDEMAIYLLNAMQAAKKLHKLWQTPLQLPPARSLNGVIREAIECNLTKVENKLLTRTILFCTVWGIGIIVSDYISCGREQ